MKCVSNTGLQLYVLALVFVSLIVAQTCPYTHPNCKCEGVTVTCGNLQAIPPLNTGSDVTAVKIVRFGQGYITSVPENSLPPGLVEISFSENPLTNISDNVFTNSSTTLKSLSIRIANFAHIPNAFTKLTNLESLRLDTIAIKDWNRPALQNIIGTLQSLYLKAVDLSVWPQWISECHLLNTLNINAATMSTIPDDAFVAMNNTLTYFTVQFTNLTQVPKALSVLRNLTALEISGVHLANVSGREGFEQLTSFPLANTLVTLSGRLLYMKSLPNLSSLKNVTYLELFLNEITQVTSDMLPQALVTLVLSYNSITKLTDTSFANLSRLDSLYLASNPISVISNNTFRDLHSLKTLDLSYTTLTQIPLAFVLLPGLKSILMLGVKPLQCPCPTAASDLRFWYESYNKTLVFIGSCCNQQMITSYLHGSCLQQPPPTQTCPTDGTSFLADNLACKYNCLLLLLLQIIVASEYFNRLSF